MNDHPWYLRHDQDRVVYASVYLGNEYQLPQDMAGWSVLDIGAHIGCFARLCAERGARVLAFEPDADNAALFREHTAHLPGVELIEAAVSDRGGEQRLGIHPHDPAGHSLYRAFPGHRMVKVVSFEEALLLVRQRWAMREQVNPQRVSLVKIDAEGVEYPIVENAPFAFALVDRLAIEFHDNYVPGARFRAQVCREGLAMLGFTERAWEATHQDHGWYRLYRGER